MPFVWRTKQALARQLRGTRAVLFDHTGTLLRAKPDDGSGRILVEPTAGAVYAVSRVRGAGLFAGVVGLGSRPWWGPDADPEIRAAVEAILGPLGSWRCATSLAGARGRHHPQAPELVLAAAADLGLTPHDVAVVSDEVPDLEAAQAAGAVGILVRTPHTGRAPARGGPLVATTLNEAVGWVLHGIPSGTTRSDTTRTRQAGGDRQGPTAVDGATGILDPTRPGHRPHTQGTSQQPAEPAVINLADGDAAAVSRAHDHNG